MDSFDTPPHHAELNLATTPLQFFRHADRLLLEAAKIQELSDELCQRSESMREKASQLRTTASELQRMGVQDRARVSKSYERVLREHKANLLEYKLAKPQAVEELGLAIEEGRVLLEEVEAFGDKMQNFTQIHAGPASDCSSDEDTEDISEIASNSADIQSGVCTSTDQGEEPAVNGHNAVNPGVDLSDKCYDLSVTSSSPSSSGADRAAVAIDSKVDTVSVVDEPSVSKGKRAPEIDRGPNEVDATPVSKRVRRRYDTRKGRKTVLLRRIGYADSEISEALLHSVKTPPRNRKKRVGRNKLTISNGSVRHSESGV